MQDLGYVSLWFAQQLSQPCLASSFTTFCWNTGLFLLIGAALPCMFLPLPSSLQGQRAQCNISPSLAWSELACSAILLAKDAFICMPELMCALQPGQEVGVNVGRGVVFYYLYIWLVLFVHFYFSNDFIARHLDLCIFLPTVWQVYLDPAVSIVKGWSSTCPKNSKTQQTTASRREML